VRARRRIAPLLGALAVVGALSVWRAEAAGPVEVMPGDPRGPQRCVAARGGACGFAWSACECQEGFVCEVPHGSSDTPGTCVPVRPCTVVGRTYQPGEEFRCDCNTCICISGDQVLSTLMSCYQFRR